MSTEARDLVVSTRSRPTPGRAAAAARLAGAESGEEAVAERMRHAARRAVPAVAGAAALAVAPVLSRLHPQEAERPLKEEARPRHLRLVPEGLTPAQRRRRARALVMASIGAAAMIGMALVYFHVVLAQRQFALDHLQSQVQSAQSTYQQQRLQVAQLGSPGQIISRAEGELGMIQPDSVAYVAPAAGVAAPATTGTPKEPLGQVGRSEVAPASAPRGDAAWPTIKQQLAGIP